MFSKSQIKFINSLSQKKYRQKHRMFLVEGKKAVSELLASQLRLHHLFTTEDIFEVPLDKKGLISITDLKKISQMSTPQTVLAVFEFPEPEDLKEEGLILALDGIQDPGNLGTIIRMCDWFGIKQLLCAEGTVDCYNPKVVQATMGSISRVNILYLDLAECLKNIRNDFPVYGSFLEGENIYAEELPAEGIIVMGNEANGISEQVELQIKNRLTIPQFGKSHDTESLNVATATAIVLSEFRRRIY